MYSQLGNVSLPAASANKLPVEYIEALKRTPMGIATLDLIGNFDARPLRVEITSGALGDGSHGQTGVTRKGLFTSISTENTSPAGDRMNGWKAEEMINIIGIHESGHYVVTEHGAFADQCYSLYCECHEKVIYIELVARLQYSLIQPAPSAKAGWLGNYRNYFAAAKKMQEDPDFSALCRACVATTVNSAAREQAAIAARTYEDGNPPQPPFDGSIGDALALKAYDEALSGLEVSASRFVANGVYEDIGLYKRVIANLADYRSERTFALVP